MPRLKRIDKEGGIPIVVLTVRNGQEDRDLAQSLGAYAYITKPFVMDDLIEVIRSALHIERPPHLTLVNNGEKSA